MKQQLRKLLPRPLLLLYNRLISRRIIRHSLGSWFESDWKQRAPALADRTWVEVYDRAWTNHPNHDLTAGDLSRIKAEIAPGWSVLDVGCGDGLLLSQLDASASRLTGVDISGAALRLAGSRISRAGLVQGFMEALPFRDGAFDAVITTHTLEHVKDLKRAVAELTRLARRRVVVLVPIQEYLPYTVDYHLHFFSDCDDLRRKLELPQARCEQYLIPPGEGQFSGAVMLMALDLQ